MRPSNIRGFFLNEARTQVVNLADLSIQIEIIRADKESDSTAASGNYRTIFHSVVHGRLPASETSTEHLIGEASVVLGAGTTTTAHTLTCITVHLLSIPVMRQRLEQELGRVVAMTGGDPRLEDLESQPFVNAVVKEGLRLAIAVITMRQRLNPGGPVIYGEWVIPKGTPVSMSTFFQLRDEAAFPDPEEFRPDRWLRHDRVTNEVKGVDQQGNENAERMKQAFTPFSRGTRNCLGMNPFYMELYFVIDAMF